MKLQILVLRSGKNGVIISDEVLNSSVDYIVSVDCFWKSWHVYNINNHNTWAWGIFSSFFVFVNFFLQCHKVLSYKSCTCLVKITPKIFYSVWSYCKRCCFHDFIFSPFAICMYKDWWFIWIHFVSSYCTDNIYEI